MIPREEELIYRCRWLVRIRWLVPFVMGIGVLGAWWLGLPYHLWPLAMLALAVAIYNVIFVSTARWALATPVNLRRIYRFVNIQIATDFLVLLAWVHFTGGPVSPFLPFFIFHLVICGLLVSLRSTLIHTVWVLVALVLIFVAEINRWIPHYCPIKAPANNPIEYLPHVLSIGIVTITTLATIAIMVGGIAKRLRRRETQLMETREALEAHSKEMEEAHAQLEKLSEERNSFFRMVSHQLRSPLTSIQGVLRLVTSKQVEDTQMITDLVTRADRQAQNMLELINDLLSLTRLKSMQDAERSEPIAMSQLLADVAEHLQNMAHEHKIQMVTDIDAQLPTLPGVRNKLKQLFVVLMENAIKYTGEGGKVTLKAERRNDFVYILVSDTGIGIPEEAQQKIFEEFYRAPNAKKHTRVGTGLGLSMACSIVKEMKGNINLDSEPGKGSTFTVMLPVM